MRKMLCAALLMVVGLTGCSYTRKPQSIELTSGVTEVQAVGAALQRRADVAAIIGNWESTEFFQTRVADGQGTSIFGISRRSFTMTGGLYRITGSEGVAIVDATLERRNNDPWTFEAGPAIGEVTFLDAMTVRPRSAEEIRADEEASQLFLMASKGEVSFPADVLPAGPLKRIDALAFPIRLDARFLPKAPRLYRVTGAEESRVLAIKDLPEAVKSAEFIHTVPDRFYPAPRAINLYTAPEGK